MGMFFWASGRFRFGCGGVCGIKEEGVDIEGEGDGVEGGLVEEGRGEIAEAELPSCGRGSARSRVVGYWKEVLNGGLGVEVGRRRDGTEEELTRSTRRGCWEGSLRSARREKEPD